MECQVCFSEVSEDGEVSSVPGDSGEVPERPAGQERNWIVCSMCGNTVCYACCRDPGSGYCDSCIERHNVYADLVELGLVEDTQYEPTA
jgi:hypothetical protein